MKPKKVKNTSALSVQSRHYQTQGTADSPPRLNPGQSQQAKNLDTKSGKRVSAGNIQDLGSEEEEEEMKKEGPGTFETPVRLRESAALSPSLQKLQLRPKVHAKKRKVKKHIEALISPKSLGWGKQVSLPQIGKSGQKLPPEHQHSSIKYYIWK